MENCKLSIVWKGVIKMNRNLILAVIAIAIIAVGAAFVVKNSPTQNRGTQNQIESALPTQEVTEPSASDSGATENVKEFTVAGSPFKFDIKEIRVKRGEKVKIVFKNAAGTHNFSIDELNLKTPVISGGEEAVLEFTADKAGTFEYYCSVGNHKEMGMVGTLVVE